MDRHALFRKHLSRLYTQLSFPFIFCLMGLSTHEGIMGRYIIHSELQLRNCCIFNVRLQPWPHSQLAHICSANNCFHICGDLSDIKHYMTILHIPFPPTKPLALQNFTCCTLQITATNKQNRYLPVPLIPPLPCHNPSPPPALAIPLPRPATQVEMLLCATFVLPNTRAFGGIFGTLPGPRAASEHQPGKVMPEPGHRAGTDPSAATTRAQGTNTARRKFLGIISPKAAA